MTWLSVLVHNSMDGMGPLPILFAQHFWPAIYRTQIFLPPVPNYLQYTLIQPKSHHDLRARRPTQSSHRGPRFTLAFLLTVSIFLRRFVPHQRKTVPPAPFTCGRSLDPARRSGTSRHCIFPSWSACLLHRVSLTLNHK